MVEEGVPRPDLIQDVAVGLQDAPQPHQFAGILAVLDREAAEGVQRGLEVVTQNGHFGPFDVQREVVDGLRGFVPCKQATQCDGRDPDFR